MSPSMGGEKGRIEINGGAYHARCHISFTGEFLIEFFFLVFCVFWDVLYNCKNNRVVSDELWNLVGQ